MILNVVLRLVGMRSRVSRNAMLMQLMRLKSLFVLKAKK